MESFKQKRANLLNENPIASHGSWISKHSIAAGSPVHMGGSGKSPLYQETKPRLTWDGGVLYDQRAGEVVIGGRHNAQGEFVPETNAQIEREAQIKAEDKKAKIKKRKEAEFNKPENKARREANKAKQDAALAAREARDAKSGAEAAAKREANKAKLEAALAARDKRRG